MKKRQKELEEFGYQFIRINPDKIDFKDYEEFGRVSAYIAESATEKSTKNQLKSHWLMMIIHKNC